MDTQLSPPAKKSPDYHKPTGLSKTNQVGNVMLYGIPIVSLFIESQERLCLAQISNTLLKQFSYNEIHNRRVALGITCVQCTPVQLEILRRAGAMPVSSRRCGMITRREAERLCKSFLGDNAPPRLPDDFAFSVFHECAWGCRGSFLPSRYNSSRAKCIKCLYCGLFFSPNKFIFHSHRIGPSDKYVQPDAANFNSWRRHMKLFGGPPQDIVYAWEDVKAMFNGGTRKRVASDTSSEGDRSTPQSSGSAAAMITHSPKRIKLSSTSPANSLANSHRSSTPHSMQSLSPPYPPNGKSLHVATAPNLMPGRLSTTLAPDLPFSRSFMMDYMWHQHQQQAQKPPTAAQLSTASNIGTLAGSVNVATTPFPLSPYALPWLKRPSAFFFPPVNGTGGAGNPAATGMTSNDLPSNSGLIDSKALGFYNHSAFKPVNNNGQQHHQSRHAELQTVTRDLINTTTHGKGPVSSEEEDNNLIDYYQSKSKKSCAIRGDNKEDPGIRDQRVEEVEANEEDDDEILVDIETTEDDDVPLKTSSTPPPSSSSDHSHQPRVELECKAEDDSPLLSPKFFNSPNLQQLDSNNNTREDLLKRSSRNTPNHMSNTLLVVSTPPPLPQPPHKEDNNPMQSKSSAHYSIMSNSVTPLIANSPTAAILPPNPSPRAPHNQHHHHHHCTSAAVVHENGDFKGVSRLHLDRTLAGTSLNASSVSGGGDQHPHHSSHQHQHFTGYFEGENLTLSKLSGGVSPHNIYGHHHLAAHFNGRGGTGLAKPTASFYRPKQSNRLQHNPPAAGANEGAHSPPLD